MDLTPENPRRLSLWRQAVALAVPLALCVFELTQWNWSESGEGVLRLLVFITAAQTGPYLVWFALAPPALLFSKWRWAPLRTSSRPAADSTHSALVCFSTIAVLATGIAVGFGWKVKDLPFAYHDEYSYLFQAQTFLAGRLYFEPSPFASFFDQVHVLNDTVFASRYFPGTGIFLVPFVAAGLPVAGSWVCHGLIAGFSALIARRFSPASGWIAGLLVASSPGMVLLANLLLSPSPTMLGMVVFYWGYFRLMDRLQWRWAVVAGLAIGFAFLTRPLTAAGMGYPFALNALVRLAKPSTAGEAHRSRRSCLAALILSFGVFVVAMAGYNAALTGSPLTSPYGVYTAKHTPSHIYGFYNKQRGTAARGEHTHLAYDEWSEDLTWPRAGELVAERCWGVVRWSLGVVPVFTLLTLLLLSAPQWNDPLLLLASSIVGLILAYTPYGHPGMFGWGYLFEATPVLLLCLATAAGRLSQDWRERGRPMIGVWWQGVWIAAIVVNLVQSLPAVFAAGSEVVHPRQVADVQAKLERAAAEKGPILVIVDADPKESLHSTYVHNQPTLNGPVLRAWYRGEKTQEFVDAYPDRVVYAYRPASNDWRLVRPALRTNGR